MDNKVEQARKTYARKQYIKTLFLNTILVLMSVTFVLPFIWMIFASLKPLDQIENDNWIPQPHAKIVHEDFKDVDATVKLILEGKEAHMVYVRGTLGEQLITKLQKTEKHADDLNALINKLDGILTNDDLVKHAAFSRFIGSERIAELTGEDSRKLRNRYILMNAFPSHFREPVRLQWGNFLKVFDVIPYARYYWNTIFVACWVTFLQVLTSALAAYAFARLSWKGRDKVFLIYLGTMMLPGLVMMIPNYQIMIKLGLVDTLTGLIIPSAFTTFGCFMLRQFMLGIPESLDEAAEIDGASKWQIFWDIILPLTRPGLVTLAIFTFMGNYNSFFWPLVMLRSEHLYTLPIGLLAFDGTAGQETNLLMAAVTMSVVPMVIVFVFFQKQLVHGIQLGGVKE